MKKPSYEDFGLTEATYKLHDEQYSNYCKKLENHVENIHQERKTYGIVVIIISAILTIILYCLLESEYKSGCGYAFAIGLVISFVVVSTAPDVYSLRKDIKDEIYKQTVDKTLEEKCKKFDAAIEDFRKTQKEYWVQMSGYEFEGAIAELYKKMGYTANVTPKSGDGGIDVILEKYGQRIAVQCKHHSKPVGPNDVRALQGVVVAQGFDSGIFVSLNGFTQTVRDEVEKAKAVKINLVELRDLMEISEKIISNNQIHWEKQDLEGEGDEDALSPEVVWFGRDFLALDTLRSLKRIIIPDEVTIIEDDAFKCFGSLESITISDSVKWIESAAFKYCGCAKSIDVDEKNLNYKAIDGNLYSKDGTVLVRYVTGKTDTEFTIPDGVTDIFDYAFYNCAYLTSIHLPTSLKNIGNYAFSGCDQIEDIQIPNEVLNIGDSAFEGCTSLTSIIIPESVTNIGANSFCNCDSLITIYCESQSQPTGWNFLWNDDDATVVWGYSTKTEESNNKVITKCNFENTQSVITYGAIFNVSTNAKLLNELFCKNYKSWMKCTYPLTDTCFLWMVAIDGQNRSDWVDIWKNGEIHERYVGSLSTIPTNAQVGMIYKRRAVFEKVNAGYRKYFVFRGVFELVENQSRLSYRILRKISDTTNLKDF